MQDIPHDEDDAAIAVAIIAMAHNLKLGVIAEGVATREQLAYLRGHQCDLMQGDYFSPPLSSEAYIALLRERPRLPLSMNREADRLPLPLEGEGKGRGVCMTGNAVHGPCAVSGETGDSP